MKERLYLLCLLITSCKSTTSASDESVTAGFIMIVLIFVFISGGMIWVNIEESNENRKIEKQRQEKIKTYNSPREKEKRELAERRRIKIKNQKKIDYQDYRKENPHLFNSSKNLKLSIQKLGEFVPCCKKCENRKYTIWELYEYNLILRCDVCKKKSTVNDEVVSDIFINYNSYLELEKYCTNIEGKINIIWKRFNFDRENFNINTPLYRGIRFQSFGEKQLVESINKKETRSRRISQKVKDEVWNRDGGKCVECDSKENLEFDHIIPHSKGGANTYRNIQLLCEPCNRSKSAKIG